MKMFFVGFHNLHKAWAWLDCVFVSVNRLWDISSLTRFLGIAKWVMDSGAFTEITKHGRYTRSVQEYADKIKQFSADPGLLAVVAQDFMCEPFVLAQTGATDECLRRMSPRLGPIEERKLVRVHQRWTIERYDALMACDIGGATVMPVLQGFDPAEYVAHIRQYGPRLGHGAWVGVGSVCKRQGRPTAILAVLEAIYAERPDLRLHGFGVKITALRVARIVELLFSADSMAWSFAARKKRGDANSVANAHLFEREVLEMTGIEPGEKLASRIRQGGMEQHAAHHNGKVAVRRAKNEASTLKYGKAA